MIKVPRRRKIHRAKTVKSRQTKLTDIPRPKVGKVKSLSPKVYRRTKKRLTIPMSTRNKNILRYAQNGTTEKELCEKLGLRPRTARVELKYLQKLGLLK